MQIIDWETWLDRHIPYYEVERFQTQYEINPPQVVLGINVLDRHRNKQTLLYWHEANAKLSTYNTAPLFLERDTHQIWYWAFWDKNQALVALMML